MTTDDAAAPAAPARPRLALDEGPLGDALDAVDRALADIETAKATLTARRHEFARVFRSEVAEVAAGADDLDDRTLGDELCAVIRALYWDHPTLRMTDLSAATGLPNDRLRRIAGPRRVEVGCTGCGAPTVALQSSRNDRVVGRCPDCRRPEPDPFADPFSDRFDAGEPPRPTVATPPDVDWLDRLLDHLAMRLRTVDCDHALTLTRRWALREGIHQDAVVGAVERFGGFCDCEVLMNAPPTAGPGSP